MIYINQGRNHKRAGHQQSLLDNGQAIAELQHHNQSGHGCHRCMCQVVEECSVQFNVLAGGHKSISSKADEPDQGAQPQFVAMVHRLYEHV